MTTPQSEYDDIPEKMRRTCKIGFLPVRMRGSPSIHVRVPTGGAQCDTLAGVQLAY